MSENEIASELYSGMNKLAADKPNGDVLTAASLVLADCFGPRVPGVNAAASIALFDLVAEMIRREIRLAHESDGMTGQ